MISKNQVKYIQSLGQKKPRDADNVFIAEGPKLVKELLGAKNCNIKAIYALKDWIVRHNISGIDVNEILPGELEKISQLKTANQVLLVAEKIFWPEETQLKGKLSLVLDCIQDPGNMGTIIRLADWFGIDNIFCSHDSAEMYNPKVVQASMGSITRVNLVYTDLVSLIKENDEIRTFAAVLDGRDISKMEKINEGVIIIGNESKGISDEILNLVNVKITIPQKGRAESLNAAVATGIILSHIV